MDTGIRYEDNKLILSNVKCNCGIEHASPDIDIYVGQNIMGNLGQYFKQRELGRNVLVVTDNRIYDLVGKNVIEVLRQENYVVEVCILEREKQLIPDEVALGEILLTLNNQTDFLLGVGSGSITDLTRYVAHTTNKPFAIVGTAPSMDGYTSVVAPLTYGNLKVNKPATYPKVLVCDLDIFSQAPYIMLLSGFGDVIGKYIAKADWILGNIVNNEPVCPLCLDLITKAVKRCMDNVTGIKTGTIPGVKALIEGLILAGITILIVGHTRPVASNEHSMAHYWEMMQLLAHHEPPRHGLSVGVATVYALKFYELFFQLDLEKISINQAKAANISRQQREQLILNNYGEKIGKAIIRDNGDDYLTWSEQEKRFYQLVNNQNLIRNKLSFLPKTQEIVGIFEELGYPWPENEIGIHQELLRKSLLYAKEYRNRYTIFKSANELGILGDLVEQVLLELDRS